MRFYRTIAVPPEERSISYLKTINQTIDGSMFEYWRANDGYRPRNLINWAARKGVEVAASQGSVMAEASTEAFPG